MRIFIYEFVTGGGWCFEKLPPESLLREAQAMVSALAADLAAPAGYEAVILEDARWPLGSLPGVQRIVSAPPDGNGNLPSVLEAARECDAAVVIAPAFCDLLRGIVDTLEQNGIRLLSPPHYFVAIASHKIDTYGLLKDYVRMPRTAQVRCSCDGRLPPGLCYPLIIKPIDGCGSDGVQLLRSEDDLIDWSFMSEYLDDVAMQDFVLGLATSVAVLCGPGGLHPLPACTQRLSDDGRFQYLGGECPLQPGLARRAEKLARQALHGLQTECGYVGLDLVLGEAEDGSQDYLIEINPRLTTSYVGLRALSNTNLAQAMLDVAQGREPQFDWKPGRVTWTADGQVEYFEK
jgi:predicted ATP-grasp superfamily ATP-dependent carboligase